jgi:hypothetical protein
MCATEERGHIREQQTEERLFEVPHFLYHYDRKKHKDCIVCSSWKVRESRKETYF